MKRYNKDSIIQYGEKDFVFRGTSMQQCNRKLLNQIKLNSFAHVVEDGQRIEQIAFMYYNNEEDWPAIAILNDMTNPWDIKAGNVLLIPIDPDYITSLLEFWNSCEPNIHLEI